MKKLYIFYLQLIFSSLMLTEFNYGQITIDNATIVIPRDKGQNDSLNIRGIIISNSPISGVKAEKLIYGKIPVDNAIITVINNGNKEIITSTKSDSKGNFFFQLSLNYKTIYKISITSKTHNGKSYLIDTRNYKKKPKIEEAYKIFGGWILNPKDSLNYDILENVPLIIYSYSDSLNTFVEDKIYEDIVGEIYKTSLILIDKNKRENEQKLLLLKKENQVKTNELNLQSKNNEIDKQQEEIKLKEIETENQQKNIELLNKDKKLKIQEAEQKEYELNQQKSILYWISGGTGLVLLMLFFAIRGYIQKRKANIIIQHQKEEVEKQKIVTEHQKELVEEKNKEILDSINYAKRIQAAILPPMKLVKEYLPQSFILYKPKDIVAGDFYWMEMVNGDQGQGTGELLLAACDCTGHGVPGAMVSVVCNNGLNRAVREYGLTDPGKILDKTREIVIQEFEKSEEEVKDGMDVSLVALIDNKIKWAGANNPLWLIRNNELFEFKPNKQPIGKYAELNPFTTHNIELQKGDTIYIFTDGFQDQFGGEKGKKFKTAKFKELLLSIQEKSMEQQRKIIDETFESWKSNLEQNDDVCVIGVRV